MKFVDFIALIHPVLAVVFVFPLIGITSYLAWNTRQRRLQIAQGKKTQIPPISGKNHVNIGRWLTAGVVGITLIALAYSVVYGSNGFIDKASSGNLELFSTFFICLMFAFTITSLIFLYRARLPIWRGIFATLTGMGLIVIGAQDGVWRLSNQWYWSHYYIGIAAALLMIFSLAIVQDIYQDRTNKWRQVHIILNSLALLLFIGQGMTGTRDLLEIPLSWQKPTIYQCDFTNKICE